MAYEVVNKGAPPKTDTTEYAISQASKTGGDIKQQQQLEDLKAKYEDLLNKYQYNPTIEKALQGRAEARAAAAAAGRARGEEIFKPGITGRIDTNTNPMIADILARRQQLADQAGQRSAGIADIIAQRQAANAGYQRSSAIQDILQRRQALLSGYTPEEMQAQREQLTQNLGPAQAAQMRALRGQQAASGIRGATALAQSNALSNQYAQQRAQAERDLFLQQIAEKRNALGGYEQSQRAAESEDLARKEALRSALEQSITGAEGREYQQRAESLGGLEASRRQEIANQLAAQKYNQEQANKELLGKLGLEQFYQQQVGNDITTANLEDIARRSAQAALQR